jgi:hypothetical protein
MQWSKEEEQEENTNNNLQTIHIKQNIKQQ